MSSVSSQQRLATNETNDDLESIASSSVVLSSTGDDTSYSSEITDEQYLLDRNESQTYVNITELPLVNDVFNTNNLKKQLEQIVPSNTYNNVTVTNSSNVVFGNVVKVKGVLNINLINEPKRSKANREHFKEKDNFEAFASDQSNNSENKSIFSIIPRNAWLALEPFEDYEYIEGPVGIVVICHTGGESSTSTCRNMELIRNIQTYHVDTKGWEDIGYNFLIGCDGNVYEGRGWGVVGAHTYGYNRRSIGITFVGSFTGALPTQKALEACKNLLMRGVNEGHLTNDFKLLGHRQCIETVSPGRTLFQEISKWDHFHNTDT